MVRKEWWALIALIVVGGFVFVEATGCGGGSIVEQSALPYLFVNAERDPESAEGIGRGIKMFAAQMGGKYIMTLDNRVISEEVQKATRFSRCIIYIWGDMSQGYLNLGQYRLDGYSLSVEVGTETKQLWILDGSRAYGMAADLMAFDLTNDVDYGVNRITMIAASVGGTPLGVYAAHPDPDDGPFFGRLFFRRIIAGQSVEEAWTGVVGDPNKPVAERGDLAKEQPWLEIGYPTKYKYPEPVWWVGANDLRLWRPCE